MHPNLSYRAQIAVITILLLALGLHSSRREIRELRAALAAKPAVQDRVVVKTVQGPTKIEYRTITTPGGTITVERIRTVESKVIERDTSHQEAPVIPLARVRTRYAGLGVDPLAYARLPRLRAGVTILGALDAGLAYDSRFSPAAGAFQIELAYRF